VPRLPAAPQLGDEGFFDVDTPAAAQAGGVEPVQAEALFTAAAAEPASWTELPADPEMENTARMAVGFKEPGAAPVLAQSAEWGTEAQLGDSEPAPGTDEGWASHGGEAPTEGWDSSGTGAVAQEGWESTPPAEAPTTMS